MFCYQSCSIGIVYLAFPRRSVIDDIDKNNLPRGIKKGIDVGVTVSRSYDKSAMTLTRFHGSYATFVQKKLSWVTHFREIGSERAFSNSQYSL